MSAPTTKGAGGKDLKQLIEDAVQAHYKEGKPDEKSFDDFYHALHEIIQDLSEKKGAMQLKLPSAKRLEEAFKEHVGTGKLSKEKFTKIVHEVVTMEHFVVGKRALQTIFFIFGAPICAFVGKSFIPRAAKVPDDIVIPAVTSATVFILAKTNML